MKSKVTRVFGVCFILTACLLTLSLFLSTQAFAEAELHLLESRIDHRRLEVAPPPLGYFNSTDPTLVLSESSSSPSFFEHDGIHDEDFSDRYIYQDPVKVNPKRSFCLFCGRSLPYPPPPHSDATASGFADAGRLSLGAYSEAATLLDVESRALAAADASFRNRLTILPGNSGLPIGAPVTLRWSFRLHGYTDASGMTYPNRTTTRADVNFDTKIMREIEVCRPDDGTVFCFRPTAAEFFLSSVTEAGNSDPDNPFTPGETGSISNRLTWGAENNLGEQLGGAPVISKSLFTNLNTSMYGEFSVESATLVSSLYFEATVGETLEIRADLFTFATAGAGAPDQAVGSTRNHFFGSFNNNIVDPENRGLQLAFEISPETLNAQPVANAGQDGTGSVGNVATLDGSASTDLDEGPNPLNFRWFQKGGPAEVTLIGDTTATPTFTPPVEGTYIFRLIVNDGEFDSGPDDVVITVAATGENQPPVAQCQNVIVSTTLNSCIVTSASIDNGSSDPDGDTLTLSQSPAGPYPVGNTEVTLTVSDGMLSSQCSATVTVTDGQAPTITCPADQTATATSSNGAVVNFTPSATDNCSTLMTSCSSVSGSTFPLGTTPVTCTATDGTGLQSSCRFTVTVTADALTQLNGLIAAVQGLPIQPAVKLVLKSPLLVANVALQHNQPQVACGSLRVFEGVVTKLRRANKLTAVQATQLTSASQSIRTALGCP